MAVRRSGARARRAVRRGARARRRRAGVAGAAEGRRRADPLRRGAPARPPPRRRRRAPARAVRAPPTAAAGQPPLRRLQGHGAAARRPSCASLAGCVLHGPRRACVNGPVLTAHSLGRLRARARRRRPASAAGEDFLSGTSGTVGGRRGALLRARDAWLDVARGAAPRRACAAPRAAQPPRRRVLVLGVERPGSLDGRRAAPSCVRTRHDVDVVTAPPGGAASSRTSTRCSPPHPPAAYDWLLVVDDDVALPRGFLDALPVRRRALRPAARPARPPPALPRRLAGHAPRARARPRARRRSSRSGPVTAFHRDSFDVLLPFPDLRMGWGLDAHWAAVAARARLADRRRRRHARRPHAAPGGQRLPARRRRGARRAPSSPDRPYVRRDEAARDARVAQRIALVQPREGRGRRGVLPARPRPGARASGPTARRSPRATPAPTCACSSCTARSRRARRALRDAPRALRALACASRGTPSSTASTSATCRSSPRRARAPTGRWGAWAAPTLAVALRRLRARVPLRPRPRPLRRARGDAVRRARVGAPLVVSVHGGDVLSPRRATAPGARAVRRALGAARGSCSPTRPASQRGRRGLGARRHARRAPRHRPPRAAAAQAAAPDARHRRPPRRAQAPRRRPARAVAAARPPPGAALRRSSATAPSAQPLERLAAELGRRRPRRASPASCRTPRRCAARPRARTCSCMPSVDEAFGVAYVEAMAGGVPGDRLPRRGRARGDRRRGRRASASSRPATPRRSPRELDALLAEPAYRGARRARARDRRSAPSRGSAAGARRSPPTRTRCGERRPVLFVTNHAPPDRAGAFAALHEREGVELALFGGRSHHATARARGPRRAASPRRPARRPRAGRRAGATAPSWRDRPGRVALPAAYLGARRARVPFVLWARSGRTRARRRTRRAPAAAPPLPPRGAVVTYGPHVTRLRAAARGARRSPSAPQAVDNAFWAHAGRRDAARGRSRRCSSGATRPRRASTCCVEAWRARRAAPAAASRWSRHRTPSSAREQVAQLLRGRRRSGRTVGPHARLPRAVGARRQRSHEPGRPRHRHRRRRRRRRRARPPRAHRPRRPRRRRRRARRRAAPPARRPRAARAARRQAARDVAAYTHDAWADGFAAPCGARPAGDPLLALGTQPGRGIATAPARCDRAMRRLLTALTILLPRRARDGRRRRRRDQAAARRLPRRAHRRHLHAGASTRRRSTSCPTDVDEYTDCREVIQRGRLAALSAGKHKSTARRRVHRHGRGRRRRRRLGRRRAAGSAGTAGARARPAPTRWPPPRPPQKQGPRAGRRSPPSRCDVGGELVQPGALGLGALAAAGRGVPTPLLAAHRACSPPRALRRRRLVALEPCPRTPPRLSRRAFARRLDAAARRAPSRWRRSAFGAVLAAIALRAAAACSSAPLTKVEIGARRSPPARWPRRRRRAAATRAGCGARSTLALSPRSSRSPRCRSSGRSSPSDAWVEANRTLSYLAVMVGGRRARAARPAALGRAARRRRARQRDRLRLRAADEGLPRRARPRRDLRAPARAVRLLERGRAHGRGWAGPACLWLGARRSGHAALNALAYPALGLLFVALLLAYSRGALLALAFGCALWFAIVPLRLRGVAVLATSAVCGGARGASGPSPRTR